VLAVAWDALRRDDGWLRRRCVVVVVVAAVVSPGRRSSYLPCRGLCFGSRITNGGRGPRDGIPLLPIPRVDVVFERPIVRRAPRYDTCWGCPAVVVGVRAPVVVVVNHATMRLRPLTAPDAATVRDEDDDDD
jgi:hypothetical protein